jgi:SAM-dependent methyltransferase
VNNFLLKYFGWYALVLQRDPSVFDRWRLRRHLRHGTWRTLDAGCGAGEFTLYAAKLGNRAIGLSFDERLNQLGQLRAQILHIANVEFRTVDLRALDQLKKPLGKFDQIICFETIEHILNDEKVIRDLANLLQPGGQLLVTAPFKYARRLPDEVLSEHEDSGHVRWGYTHSERCALFERSGLQAEEQTYLTGIVSQTILRWTRRLGDTPIARSITFPLRLFLFIDQSLTRSLNYPFYSIAVMGTRPHLPVDSPMI